MNRTSGLHRVIIKNPTVTSSELWNEGAKSGAERVFREVMAENS
jgi:hypothetical protein